MFMVRLSAASGVITPPLVIYLAAKDAGHTLWQLLTERATILVFLKMLALSLQEFFAMTLRKMEAKMSATADFHPIIYGVSLFTYAAASPR